MKSVTRKGEKMKVIKPSFEILDELNGEEILKRIERIGAFPVRIPAPASVNCYDYNRREENEPPGNRPLTTYFNKGALLYIP